MTDRSAHEIAHGKLIAAAAPEDIWGWGTPAGKLRARRRADLVAQAAELGPGMQVMEIGCGTGMFTEMFAETGAQITAVDISPDLLEIAKGRNLPPEQVRFVCQRFEEVRLEQPLDAVIGSSVLHHLEVEESLRVIYDLLKPGGRLAFAEPNMLNPQVFAERTFLRRWSKYTSPDETAFVRWRLAILLEKVGFTGIAITPFDWLHPFTPAGLIPLVRGLGKTFEAMPGLREFSGSLVIRASR